TLYPDIQVDEESRLFLECIKQNMYRYYKGRDAYCNIKYTVDMPGLPRTCVLAKSKDLPLLSMRVMSMVLLTIVGTPLYLLACRLCTRMIKHPIIKKISPM